MNVNQAQIIDQTLPLLLGNQGEHSFLAADPKPKILETLSKCEESAGVIVDDLGDYCILVPTYADHWYRLHFDQNDRLTHVKRCWGRATIYERMYWDCRRYRDAGTDYHYANYSQPLLEDLPDRAKLEAQIQQQEQQMKLRSATVRLYEADELATHAHAATIASHYGDGFELELLGLLLLEQPSTSRFFWSKHCSKRGVKQSLWQFDGQTLSVVATRQGTHENPGEWANS